MFQFAKGWAHNRARAAQPTPTPTPTPAGMRALVLEAPPLETIDIKTLIDAGRD
jgi:hypothetical protein